MNYMFMYHRSRPIFPVLVEKVLRHHNVRSAHRYGTDGWMCLKILCYRRLVDFSCRLPSIKYILTRSWYGNNRRRWAVRTRVVSGSYYSTTCHGAT